MSLKQKKTASRFLFIFALIIFLIVFLVSAGVLAAQGQAPPPVDSQLLAFPTNGGIIIGFVTVLLAIFVANQRVIESQGKEIMRLNLDLEMERRARRDAEQRGQNNNHNTNQSN